MAQLRWFVSGIALLPLCACGGGGGTSSAGSTAAPTNSSIASLRSSQSFTNDAASATATYDLTSKTTTSQGETRSPLTISYDAGTKSYTVSVAGRSQSFGPSALQASGFQGEATYKISSVTQNDYLTLVTTPFETNSSNQYVGLGFWQRNQISGGTQATSFDIFTYGLDTPAAAVPRTGTGNFTIDAFALLDTVGESPKTLQGLGTLDTDFQSGLFSADVYVTQYDVTSNASITGGGIELHTAGHLSATDGTLTGTMSYQNTDIAAAGTISGRFYGPSGQEVGATFAGDDGKGSSLVGGFTGTRASGAATTNLSLANPVAEQLFSTPSLIYTTQYDVPGGKVLYGGTYAVNGQLTLETDGSMRYSPGPSNLTYATFAKTDQIAGAANFTTYRTSVDGKTLTLGLYNPGSTNTELALTYATFGIWSQTSPQSNQLQQSFLTYGIATPYAMLSRRTGTGHYDGVAYGAAVDANGGSAVHYSVNGTSSLDVDFGAQTIAGALALRGTADSGATRNFGSFAAAGTVSTSGQSVLSAVLSKDGAGAGRLEGQFYGPDGEEIAGTFNILLNNAVPDQAISLGGVTVAKRH